MFCLERLIKMKGSKGFTLIELILIMAILAILVLLATPRFLNYTMEAKLAQIVNDSKVVEEVVESYLTRKNNTLPPNGTSMDILDIKTEIVNNKVFNNKGLITNESDIIGTDFEILDSGFIKAEANSKLTGIFVASSDGRVYYIHNNAIDGTDATEDDTITDPEEDECPVFPAGEMQPIDIPLNRETVTPLGIMTLGEAIAIIEYSELYTSSSTVLYSYEGQEYLLLTQTDTTGPHTITFYISTILDNWIAVLDAIQNGDPFDITFFVIKALQDDEVMTTSGNQGYMPLYVQDYDANGNLIGCPRLMGEDVVTPEEPVGACVTPESIYMTFDHTTNTLTDAEYYYSFVNTNVVIPEQFEVEGVCYPVKHIGYDVFRGFGITSLTLPEGLLTIEGGSFFHSRIEHLVVPDSVTRIGVGAFQNTADISLPGLLSVQLPANLERIDSIAFANNHNLTEITIPEGISVGNNAFGGCNLSEITIGSDVSFSGDMLNTGDQFVSEYLLGGAGTYLGSQSGSWTKQ